MMRFTKKDLEQGSLIGRINRHYDTVRAAVESRPINEREPWIAEFVLIYLPERLDPAGGPPVAVWDADVFEALYAGMGLH
jgi:hypothetical protein